jgi:hypothetical protein
MVNMYMGDKMTSTEHTLAVTLGHPAHTRHGEDDEVEVEGDFAIALFFDITCDNFFILSILLSELPLFLFIIDLTI